MTKITVALAAVFSAAAWATPSQAGTTTITYEITGGILSGGDLDSIPIKSGTFFEVTYNAASGEFTLLDGPAVLNSFSLKASGFTVSGSFFDIVNLQLASPVAGNGTSGAGFSAVAVAVLSGILNEHCFASAASCDYYGLVPSVAKDFALFANATRFVLNGGSGSASGTYSIPAQGSVGPFSFSFTGTEINRTHIPEPHTSTLLGLGLALLAGGARQRSRGRRPA